MRNIGFGNGRIAIGNGSCLFIEREIAAFHSIFHFPAAFTAVVSGCRFPGISFVSALTYPITAMRMCRFVLRTAVSMPAAPEARARRRWLQQQKKGITESYEDVLAAVIKRDYDDSHRAAAPLRQAEDAWLCDSTHLDFEGTVQAILAYIRQRIGEVPCR